MPMVYRTVWLGITGALLLGAPSLAAAAPPLSDTAGASVPSSPSAKAANGAAPVPAPTNLPREAQPSALMASPGQTYAAPAYRYPYPYGYPSPYRYSVPPPAESSDETGRYWYGWQTLTSLGFSTTFAFLSFAAPSAAVVTVPLSIGGGLLGGPIVHWANGNVGKGFISFGINLGASAVGAAIGAGVICTVGCSGDFGGLALVVGGGIGAGIGVVISNIVDASALAYGRRRAPFDQAAATKRGSIALLPTLDIRQGRASAGVMGTF